MARLFWVCVGGGVGSGARYLLSLWALSAFGPGFPYGTLAVNVLGSFAMGALMFAGLEASAMSPVIRLTLTTGILGGFTTYSAFSYESMRYLQQGSWVLGLAYAVLTVALCLGGCTLGWHCARTFLADSSAA